MGRQYAEQIIDIFGTFIFSQLAGRSIDPAFRSAVEPWEREMARHTPELTDFSRGWADGATNRGVPMDYWDVVAIWTGTHPPSKTAVGLGIPNGCDVRGVPESAMLEAYLAFDPLAVSTRAMCSGAAAWGAATVDSGAIAVCSTDHKCTFQATIVAYPDDGHPFVYTPFAANGFIPGMGDFFMAGHPGMNAAGLAYVHHGGGFGMTEPVESWGYGIRRGAETFHILRYAASAKDAVRLDATFPVGDAGYPVGYPGGFYVDRSGGFVIEGRAGVPDKPAPIVREASFDESGQRYEFLYATNNALSPKAGSGFGVPKEGYAYDTIEGWHTTLDDLGVKAPETTARAWTAVSWKRNRYLFEELRARYGTLRLEDMITLYQQGGPCSFGSGNGNADAHPAVKAAHRGAAFTAAMDPERRRYFGCVGPVGRALPPMDGLLPHVYHDETHQFWELELAHSPEHFVDEAHEQAVRDLAEAAHADCGQRRAWADLARHALEVGDRLRGDDTDPVTLGRVVRKYFEAQVRARQASAEIG